MNKIHTLPLYYPLPFALEIGILEPEAKKFIVENPLLAWAEGGEWED